MSTRMCELCGYSSEPAESARIRSNVRRFRERRFLVWRCQHCASIHCEKVDDLAAYYEDYPLRREDKLGYFVNRWFGVILDRLVRAGLKTSHSLLDYGCGVGLFLDFLQRRGYANCVGYDPYVERYDRPTVLSDSYDFVVNVDVIEHVESPRVLIKQFHGLLKPHGHLCIHTPRAEGINLSDPEEFIHTLHMPYHVHILSETALIHLCAQQGFVAQSIYHRWFRDSWMPCTSRRFIEIFMRSHGNDMDSAFDAPKISVLLSTPALWLHALFGYLVPEVKADYMMVMFRKAVLE